MIYPSTKAVNSWHPRLSMVIPFLCFELRIGKVIVQALELKENHVMDFRRPVRSVVLDPDYAKSSSRTVVSGGMAGQLILSEKGTPTLKIEIIRMMVWNVRDYPTFWRGTDIYNFLEGTIYRLA